MEVNGELKDLSHEILKDSKVRIITSKDKEGLEVIRHDAAHIMAMAVQELFQVRKLLLVLLLKMVFIMTSLEKNLSQAKT